EADKTILESYGDTTILKRRHGDDDDQEGPSAGSDRGSKRRREGGEHESASTPSEPVTRSASRSTIGTQSRQMSASESAFAVEPVQTTCQMDEPPHSVFETEEEISWNSSDDEDVDDQTKGRDVNEGEKTDESDADDDDQDEAKKDNVDNDDEEEISKIDEQEVTESGGDDEETKSDRESKEEEIREKEEESFDPIPRTPEESEDDGNSEEDQGLRISEEERMHEEKADELYHDVNINQGRGLQVSQDIEDSHRLDEQRNLYKALVEAYEANKTILDSYGESAILKRRREDDDDQEGPSARSDRGSKRQREGREHASAITPSEPATRSPGRLPIRWRNPHIRCLKQVQKINPLFKLLSILNDTPINFSNFIMNRLGVDTLTPELLAGPTYELMRGLCNSLTELEYHLEEVYKAMTDQLDWVNPKGQQYPHNLLQPLPLIPDNRGRRVIPFEHFINNDLEYLRGGASSRKYTTSMTKTKAAGYGHIKFAVNRESALDVYSKRRIIAVTDLKIVEWHNYKHLDWISVRRDDDKIYKFKEGDFKRLRLQDIEDMLLLLVQGKLSNLTVEECFAFNVSLRMFTRSIVIQRRVEDLQRGVKSYQKRLNLTNPDTYRSDLKRQEAYTAYSYPRGFIYQNKDKKNRMQYLPTTIWRKGDKDRAAAMIPAIDKMFKTRRIMRSLERFVGGREYEGDFRMLQRTI
nr:hypothetical protein [Tanacetum cinerariifolium]